MKREEERHEQLDRWNTYEPDEDLKKTLTQKQREVYEARFADSPVTDYPTMGSRLGISSTVAISTFKRACEKIDRERNKRLYRAFPILGTKDEPSVEKLSAYTGSAARLILENISMEDVRKAGLRDKMQAASLAIQNWRLLQGMPTEIVRIEEAKRMDEVARMILGELSRRGYTDIPKLDPVTYAPIPEKPVHPKARLPDPPNQGGVLTEHMKQLPMPKGDGNAST